jgi:hypothetical protein
VTAGGKPEYCGRQGEDGATLQQRPAFDLFRLKSAGK